jgi:hypothetical protein
MQKPNVTRAALIALAIICLIQGAWIIGHHNFAPELSRVVQRYALGDTGMVYVVVDNSGGATVPFIYRYYLSTRSDDDEQLLQSLSKDDHAFLVTRDGDAKVSVEGMRVKVSVNDSVYRFVSPVSLRRGDRSALVDIWLDARPDNSR